MTASLAVEYLDTRTAAAFLGFKPSTLATWRVTRSDGPRFIRAGGRRILYAISDLREWMDLWKRRSTSDDARVLSVAR